MAERSNRLVVFWSLAALAAMIGLVAASVPLYRLYCQVTGYGGTTRVAEAAPEAAAAPVGPLITVRFDASVAKGMPWKFTPQQRQVRIHLGEQVLAFYSATNTSDKPVTGTATFNVTPDKVGQYFNKIECFCFTEQTLQPGQTVDMPVTFFIDPALADDKYANEVTTITLSYTFFNKTTAEQPPRTAQRQRGQ